MSTGGPVAEVRYSLVWQRAQFGSMDGNPMSRLENPIGVS